MRGIILDFRASASVIASEKVTVDTTNALVAASAAHSADNFGDTNVLPESDPATAGIIETTVGESASKDPEELDLDNYQ